MNTVQELSYATYEIRQRHEITLDQLLARSKQLKIGGRFERNSYGSWTPTPYPGFAMQALMLPEGPNAATYAKLEVIRDALISGFEDSLAPLPSPSFHQTMANIFSADRLEENVTSKGLLPAFANLVAGGVKDIFPPETDEPVNMQLIGISMFRTAIGVLGVFDRASDFDRVIDFRERFYGHRKLKELGIVRTRPFIGHVTLAYVQADMEPEECEALAHQAHKINATHLAEPLPFLMRKVQFCRYDDLTAFYPRYDYPSALI
jgi:hypothetical protein